MLSEMRSSIAAARHACSARADASRQRVGRLRYVEAPQPAERRTESVELSHPRWGVIILAWTVPALVAAYSDYGAAVLRGHALPFWRAVAIEFPGWYVWILFTPLVFALARRFPLRGLRSAWPLLAHTGLMAVAALVYTTVYAWSNAVFGLPPITVTRQYIEIVLVGSTLMTLVLYAATLAAVLAVASERRNRAHELRTAALATQLVRAELQTLRGQLHPHMLFNALHTIALLARRNSGDEAARVTNLLAGVLRSVLESGGADERTLGEEIALVEQYLDIELVRFADRLGVQWNVAAEVRDAMVPTLFMQPLVENALRHGISRLPEGGTVAITAVHDADTLEITVWNSGPPLLIALTGHRGLGVRNTAERLARLYGAGGTLSVTNDPRGGVSACVRVPWRRSPVPYQLPPLGPRRSG
jgi:two-component system LytT family sensor kinase